MPVFTYKAHDPLTGLVRGDLAADTAQQAREVLRTRGLQLLQLTQAKLAAARRPRLMVKQSRRDELVADFARQLALLLRTGVNVTEALDVILRQPRQKFTAALHDVRERVASGQALSDALAQHPAWFETVFITAVRVGQASGNMDAALTELAEHLNERHEVRQRVVNALMYPAILSVVATGVVLFLMSFVVPQLLAVLEASGRALPRSTLLLKWLSDVLIQRWPWLVLAGGAVVGMSVVMLRYPNVRRAWDGAKLRLPLLGPLLKKAMVAQFAQMTALLLRTGVTLVDALEIGRTSARNVILREELAQLNVALRRGAAVADGLRKSTVFPPLVVHLMHVGQTSGELTELLGHLDTAYRKEVRQATTRFSAVLEPALIVLLSAVIGYVIFATMVPLLEVTRTIQ